MQERKVILTWESIYDVTEIAEYIEKDFGIERADMFQIDIKANMNKLGYLGGITGETSLLYRGYHIHKKLFLPSLIFYVVMNNINEIHVLRVLRAERDWKSILQNVQKYTYLNDDL